MSNDPYQHHTHTISEDTYHCERYGKTLQKDETCSDNDVTKDNSLTGTPLPPSEHARNSDGDVTEDDTSTILPLPLPLGEIQLSPKSNSGANHPGNTANCICPLYARHSPFTEE